MVSGVLAVLVVGLLRSHADILRALHELGVGEARLRGEDAASFQPGTGIRADQGVPEPGPGSAMGRLHDIDGALPEGGAARIGLVDSSGTTLLAFLSSGCSTCLDFWRAFGTDAVRQVPGRDARVVVITRSPAEESPAEVAALAPEGVTTVMSSQAWDDYDVPVAPYFLLVDGRHGVVGEGASSSWAQVVDLLGKAAADAGVGLDVEPALSRRDLFMGRDREQQANRELAAAGIQPGSSDLYAPVHPEDDRTDG